MNPHPPGRQLDPELVPGVPQPGGQQAVSRVPAPDLLRGRRVDRRAVVVVVPGREEREGGFSDTLHAVLGGRGRSPQALGALGSSSWWFCVLQILQGGLTLLYY